MLLLILFLVCNRSSHNFNRTMSLRAYNPPHQTNHYHLEDEFLFVNLNKKDCFQNFLMRIYFFYFYLLGHKLELLCSNEPIKLERKYIFYSLLLFPNNSKNTFIAQCAIIESSVRFSFSY